MRDSNWRLPGAPIMAYLPDEIDLFLVLSGRGTMEDPTTERNTYRLKITDYASPLVLLVV